MMNVMCGFDTTNKPLEEVEDKIYTKGCLKGFGQWLERNTIVIGAVCLAVMIPQVSEGVRESERERGEGVRQREIERRTEREQDRDRE